MMIKDQINDLFQIKYPMQYKLICFDSFHLKYSCFRWFFQSFIL